MNKIQYKFSGKTTTYYFDADFSYLEKLVDKDHAVLVTDEHIFNAQQKRFGGWNTIVINAGEQYKVQATVDSVDLTQDPPQLSINGQNYTLDKIKRIVRRTT